MHPSPLDATVFYSNFRLVYPNSPSPSLFSKRDECQCQRAMSSLAYTRVSVCTSLHVLTFSETRACVRAIRPVPLLNFTPRPLLASLPPPPAVSNVTVVSRATASPTRAGTHTQARSRGHKCVHARTRVARVHDCAALPLENLRARDSPTAKLPFLRGGGGSTDLLMIPPRDRCRDQRTDNGTVIFRKRSEKHGVAALFAIVPRRDLLLQ